MLLLLIQLIGFLLLFSLKEGLISLHFQKFNVVTIFYLLHLFIEQVFGSLRCSLFLEVAHSHHDRVSILLLQLRLNDLQLLALVILDLS